MQWWQQVSSIIWVIVMFILLRLAFRSQDDNTDMIMPTGVAGASATNQNNHNSNNNNNNNVAPSHLESNNGNNNNNDNNERGYHSLIYALHDGVHNIKCRLPSLTFLLQTTL
jgi:hypothetical protein